MDAPTSMTAVAMSRPLARSTGGCWTCRIRHRKCDESSPACKECTERHIKCHGYGPEPEWVKNPSRLRAELQRIKHAVKQNFRQTRKAQAARSPRKALQSRERETMTDDSQMSSSTESSEFREAELLMYYLDYIFPLQYAYYVDNPAAGGRAWLFWLLSKRGPLRHAAFTLSALHQHSISHTKTEDMESELIRYHTNAMQELRQVLSHCEMDGFSSHPEYRVEFLTCGTFLISFEVFQGGTSKWEPHLNALLSVVGQFSPGDSAFESQGAETGMQRMMNAAMRFHMAQLLWFDLVSCVATAKAPNLPYREWLDLDNLDVSWVMGCQNWALSALGDVASLETQLQDMDSTVATRTISDIADRIHHGIEGLENYEEESEARQVCQAVTRVYATAILVQICTLSTSDEKYDEEIHRTVERVIQALLKVPKGTSLRGMTWPICVAGAVASQSQQAFFTDLLGEILERAGTGFTNCGTVLLILKESWKLNDGFSCNRNAVRSAMERLGIRALLV